MAKIIKFPKQKRHDQAVLKLKDLSDRLDDVILGALAQEGIDPKDVAGLLAHRLGSLMRPMSQKDRLWDVCEKVAKRQAVID